MKKLILIGLLFTFHASALPQNVGIGEIEPTHKLTVAGSIKAVDSIIASILQAKKLILADTSVNNGSRIILNGNAGNQGDVLISGGQSAAPFWGAKSILFWSPFALGYVFGDLNHQVPDNTEKMIIWKYPINNPYFLYDTTTGKYTVLQSGTYNLNLHVCLGDASKNLPIYQVSLKVWKSNRVLPLIDITHVGFGANTFNKLQAVGLVILDAGDQFYATVSQNSGSTLLLNDAEGLTYISGYKVY